MSKKSDKQRIYELELKTARLEKSIRDYWGNLSNVDARIAHAVNDHREWGHPDYY